MRYRTASFIDDICWHYAGRAFLLDTPFQQGRPVEGGTVMEWKGHPTACVVQTGQQPHSAVAQYRLGAKLGTSRLSVMRPSSLWLSHFTPGIGPVKWHGSPLHTSGAFVAGNAQRWGQKQRESVGPVWLI